jgi:hypothetical protein
MPAFSRGAAGKPFIADSPVLNELFHVYDFLGQIIIFAILHITQLTIKKMV